MRRVLSGPRPASAPRAKAGPLLVLAALLGACGEDWQPITYVDQLRILAVRAEPPELAPGASAELSALTLDPRSPARANTLLWFACDPEPGSLTAPDCAKYASVDQADDLLATRALPPGLRWLGFSCGDAPRASCGSLPRSVRYHAPGTLFEGLDPADPRRQAGSLAYVLVMALAAPPPADLTDGEELDALIDKVGSQKVDSIVALKRVRLSEAAAPNANPALQGVRFGTQLWPPGTRPVKLRGGQNYALAAVGAPGASEHFVQPDADGRPVAQDEQLIVSWYSTAGLFDVPRTLADPAEQLFAIGASERPLDRRGSMFLIVRDGRGGEAWMDRGFYVCDPALPPLTLTSIEPASGPPVTRVVLRGTNLQNVLDVRVGDGELAELRYDPGEGTLSGFVPSTDVSGTQQVLVRGKGCASDPSTSFEVTP